jgi:hypothetical protein
MSSTFFGFFKADGLKLKVKSSKLKAIKKESEKQLGH